MNFRKKTIGNILSLNHIWVARRGGNDIVIHFEDKQGSFWFEVIREGKLVYNSQSEDVCFKTLEEAESFIESWIQERLFGRIKRKAKLSMEKRYMLLLDAVKRFVENNPGAEELNSILKKLN